MEITVTDSAPLRLDVFLSRELGASRQRVRELLLATEVRVNGQRARKGEMVREGDIVTVASVPTDAATLVGEPDLPVRVLYSDHSIIAVDKPAAIPGHAVRATDRATVANFLVGRFPELSTVGPQPFSAGLVHRLDTLTSGVLLAARSPAVYASLRRQFDERRVKKEYLAMVCGDWPEPRSLTAPIAHAPRHPKRMYVCSDPAQARLLKARDAITHCWPLERFGRVTLLRVEIPTGVRHQIRVHLAAAGHPLIGEPLYRSNLATPIDAARTFLHAARITVHRPENGDLLTIEAALPKELQNQLAYYRQRK